MKTQIYATFGPSCVQKNVLKQMIEAGMTGMRLNLSHISLDKSEDYIQNYKQAAKEAGVIPQILIDMQGPELRLGELNQELSLQVGQEIICCDLLKYGDLENQLAILPIPREVIAELQEGDEILLDDGKISIQILRSEVHEGGYIVGQVLRGGVLKSHKSVKVVNKNIKMPALTQHDIENIKLATRYGITALMQPFVLDGEDLRYVRKVLEEHNAQQVQIFAKIENRLGVEHIEQILPEADVVIIARGDLGNDMPLWELPKVQKHIEEACKKAGKPYIVVTQMLASMEKNPVPTRAEVSDVFHAVYHGAWGIMLTGETAVGEYPVEAVKYLVNTAREASDYKAI